MTQAAKAYFFAVMVNVTPYDEISPGDISLRDELTEKECYLRLAYDVIISAQIGVRIAPDGSTLPLFYGEVKIDAGNQYHPVPRTRPSEE
jgi:hypothetical protein